MGRPIHPQRSIAMENMAEVDPYRVLGIDPKPNLTDAEIKKAYRKLALKLHPDKRKDSERERAQQEFDQLQKAYDILLDPEARAALENLAKARQATRQRHESQDAKRRKMREDLERRERAAERGRNEEEEAKDRLQQELARLRKTFATRRKGYDAEATKGTGADANGRSAHGDGAQKGEDKKATAVDVPEHMYRTLKVVWRKDISDYAASGLREIFDAFGTVEDVVIRDGKRRKGSALVVFADAAQAERAAAQRAAQAALDLEKDALASAKRALEDAVAEEDVLDVGQVEHLFVAEGGRGRGEHRASTRGASCSRLYLERAGGGGQEAVVPEPLPRTLPHRRRSPQRIPCAG